MNMNLITNIEKDFETLVNIENELMEKLNRNILIQKEIETFSVSHLDHQSRTSTEKQILALRAEHSNFNSLMAESHNLKMEIDSLKYHISILQTKNKVADTLNRYSQIHLNLIEE